MDDKQPAAPMTSAVDIPQWTRIDDYIVALARRRTARRLRQAQIRTEPENPTFVLSTLPFALVLAALMLLVGAIAVIAWPGSLPHSSQPTLSKERGVAARGWLEDAEKEFR